MVTGKMSFAPVILASTSFGFLSFALPIYTREMGESAVAIGGLYTALMLSMLLFRPIVGWALDRFGRRWFFTAAFAFYTVAMLIFAQSSSINGFYLARFVQGIGGSLMWVSARTIIADVTTPADRGRQMGLLAGRSVQGTMVGAALGFALVWQTSISQAWPIIFLGYAGLSALGFVWSLLRQSETAPQSIALKNIALKHTEPQSISDRPDPLLVPPISPQLKKLMVIVFLSGFASALIEPIYLIFLKDKFQLDFVLLAAAFFPAGIAFAIVPQHSGRWSDLYGRRLMIAGGVAMAGIVCISLPWVPTIALVAVIYTLFSVGWAIARPAENALVGDLASESNRGRVFGYKEACGSLGMAIGPLAGGAIYETFGAHMTFAVNGTMLLLTSLLTFLWFAADRPQAT